MAGAIQEVSGTSEERRELAHFLAKFVRGGGLDSPRFGDDSECCWEQRFRWWWDENPMCHDNSPLGFLLVADDEIVGFNGFIPFDYSVDGEILPTLLSTTFFVEESHRDSVMGILMKLRRLGNDYQIIDGSPSEPMRELLARIGFEKEEERFQYFFPLQNLGGRFSQKMLGKFGLSLSVRGSCDPGHYIATEAEEVESLPVIRDSKLRRHLTIESLQWLTSVGTEPRSFFGLCDEKGALLAYAIGVYKERYGLKACMLLDLCDFTSDRTGFDELLSSLMDSPEEAGVHDGTDLLTWSVLGSRARPESAGLRRGSILRYSIPGNLSNLDRASVPFESDIFLL